VFSCDISIVIRTLNESKKIGLVFEALRNQRLEPDEVILVDSGSTDDTITIAKRYGATIIELAQELFTHGRALNLGFASSKGRNLVSLSGHAIPTNGEWLYNLVRNLISPTSAAVASRLIPSPKSQLHNYWLNILFLLHRKWEKNNLWLFWNTATAYRRDVWESFPFNESIRGCEDREWAKRVLASGYDIIYEPGSVVWHSHDESYLRFARRTIFCLRMVQGIERE
jgi:rhamnosyltransferase